MNNDLISREALKEAIEHYQIQWNKNCDIDIAYWNCCEKILAIINIAPTVEAVPLEHHNKIKGIMDNEIKSLVDILDNNRPQGEWVAHEDMDEWYECNKCHCGNTYFVKLPNFCPNCGAKMKGGAE